MYRAPFHRRILPWIFALVFLVSAPALVFYTAGYRWNGKKDKIERNGTLILDSEPPAARVLLNGRDSEETTPVTLQNVTPGSYVIRMERDGYHPWQKRLEVYPEFVTFANTVFLWRISDPVAFIRQAASHIEPSPNASFIAGMTEAASSSELLVWNADGSERDRFSFTNRLPRSIHLTWSADSRALLVEHDAATGTNAWFINVRTGVGPTVLPRGSYLWDGSSIRGVSEKSRIAINIEDGSFTRTPLPGGAVDRYGDMILKTTTGTDALVIFQENTPSRGLILPAGDWRFANVINNHIMLKTGNEWISLNPDDTAPSVHRVFGDRLRPYVTRQKTSYLLVNGGELWLWDPALEPELLLRQSQPIIEAMWHESGRSIIVATETNVSILDLDPRDGRLQTQLTTFDRLQDAALLKQQLIVSGDKNEQTAIWSLEIE
ncbi:MAG: PEGA domain-containing protein [Patescibacteria group bacterium]|jgi:hypothetical protein